MNCRRRRCRRRRCRRRRRARWRRHRRRRRRSRLAHCAAQLEPERGVGRRRSRRGGGGVQDEHGYGSAGALVLVKQGVRQLCLDTFGLASCGHDKRMDGVSV
jgi:hypothetical protein